MYAQIPGRKRRNLNWNLLTFAVPFALTAKSERSPLLRVISTTHSSAASPSPSHPDTSQFFGAAYGWLVDAFRYEPNLSNGSHNPLFIHFHLGFDFVGFFFREYFGKKWDFWGIYQVFCHFFKGFLAIKTFYFYFLKINVLENLFLILF